MRTPWCYWGQWLSKCSYINNNASESPCGPLSQPKMHLSFIRFVCKICISKLQIGFAWMCFCCRSNIIGHFTIIVLQSNLIVCLNWPWYWLLSCGNYSQNSTHFVVQITSLKLVILKRRWRMRIWVEFLKYVIYYIFYHQIFLACIS